MDLQCEEAIIDVYLGARVTSCCEAVGMRMHIR